MNESTANSGESSAAASAADFTAREKLRYQSFDLGGNKTGGHDRSYLNPMIFSSDSTGLSYLDIGSYLGYFCIEALKRGARSATGIEPDAESVRQATALAGFAGVSPRYLHGDFEEWDFGKEQFDVVLCLNVLHHMFDAIGAINKMKRLARKKIVIEFASPSLRDLLYRSLNPLAVLANAVPAVILGNPRKNTDIASRSFLFTAKAMKVLFDRHTCAFEPVTITRSPFKGRLVLEARRRDIGHVAFVAGPTSSGKSTLFGRLAAEAGLRRQYGLEEGEWRGVHGHEIDLPRGRTERVLVHYDLLRPYRRSIRAFNRDPRCDLLSVAEKTSVITAMVAPGLLTQQLLEASGAAAPSGLGKRHKDIYERYADREFLAAWYESWFAYLGRHQDKMAVNKVLVRDGSGSERIIPASDWRAAYNALYGV
ncbi:MAG: methyltransferase domain-containing protein [Hyphomicrobiales bacterium]